MGRQTRDTKPRLRDSYPAKISTPRIGGWLPRERLFRRLDEARERARTIWMSAPAGSGKTYLIASYLAARDLPGLWYQVDESDADAASFFYYLGLAARRADSASEPLPLLTPEYLPGLSVFARNFFRALFERLERPGVLVLDDYQETPDDSPLHELLPIAVAELPEDLTLVVVSREDVPPSLARARVHGRLEELRERDLRLTRNEMSSLARRYGIGRLDAGRLRMLQSETHGWFAGVVLMLNRARDAGGMDSTLDGSDRAVLFDYFATEIFDRLDPDTRGFLERTAFLRPVTGEAARDLTGDENPETRLDRLVREHYFVVPVGDAPQAYRYHPLFERFLRNRARTTWDGEELTRVCRRAAGHAVAAGYVDEAVNLLHEIAAWDVLADLLCEQAPHLLAQGRYRSMEHWLGMLPREHVEREPWPRFWLAMARLYREPRATREMLVDAYHRFRALDDARGQYMAWIGVTSSLLIGMDDFRSLDDWLSELDDLQSRHRFPSVDIEAEAGVIAFCARVHRCERYRDVEQRAEHALELARRTESLPLQVQVLFYRGFYELVLRPSHRVLETLRELDRISRIGDLGPVETLRVKLLFAIRHNCLLDHERCREAVEDGLRTARESGVYVLDFMLLGQLAWQAVQAADARMTADALRRMDPYLHVASPWDRSLYEHIQGTWKHFEGDLRGAEAHRRYNRELHERIGESISGHIERFQAALLALERGEPDEAERFLEVVEDFAESNDAAQMRRHCRLARAIVALARGSEAEATARLRKGFAATPETGRYGFLTWPPRMLARVCEAALRRGVEVEAVRTFIRAYGLVPQSSSIDLEEWPWPVRIYTLGRFSVVVDGEAIAFRGKGQKRPLELLRALIAMGGRGVGVERLCEALWPDAEGDTAAQNLKTTLHRLRRLVGEASLELNEGRLGLNARRCWVDVWALERRLGLLEAAVDEADADPRALEAGARDLLALYRGPFLGRDADAPWALSTRERLRARLLQLLERVAARLGRGGDCARARRLCETGLQLHDLRERLYRGLMGCQAANGDRGAALRTYERCRAVLAAGPAVAPDASTERLRRTIEDDRGLFDAQLCPICGRGA